MLRKSKPIHPYAHLLQGPHFLSRSFGNEVVAASCHCTVLIGRLEVAVNVTVDPEQTLYVLVVTLIEKT